MIWSYLFFFFFKQKTAYEVRKGDWSSDVCSSDLGVFVPGLVFAAAYSIDWAELRPVLAPIVALAIPGVLASAVVVAFALHLGVGVPLELAFVVGAITAATDPVAVVATMRRLDVPRGLRTLVEGESLLNDGTGLVLFALAVRAVQAGVSAEEGVALF